MLSIIGSVASILGLSLTVWIWLKVRHIEDHFTLRARFSSIKRGLKEHSDSISRYLSNFPDSANDLEVELKRCQSDLRNLHPKLKGEMKSSASNILKRLESLPSPLNRSNKQSIRSIQLDLITLANDFENFKQDMKWRANQ